MLYVLLVYQIAVEEYWKNNGLKRQVSFGVIMLIVGLARSNGMYIIILMFLILLALIKEYRKQMLLIGIVVLTCIGMIKGPVFKMLQISTPSVAESFSIPLQQIGYTISMDGQIIAEDLEYLNRILPINDWKNSYTASNTDMLKFHQNFSRSYLDETAGEFLQVWARNLFPNFKYYVRAYLEQIRGYWDILHIANVENAYIADNVYEIKRVDYIEKIMGVSMEPICSFLVIVARKLPIVNFVTNQMILALIYLNAWAIWMWKKKFRVAVVVFPFLIQWLTLLIAAPVSSEIRYMLSFHFMLPYIIGMFYSPLKRIDIYKQVEKGKSNEKNNGQNCNSDSLL